MSESTIADRRDPWLGIELRHLAALSAIESEGTFSEAALSLGYVQSAVSGQLAMLERLTGTRLVERSRGPGPQKLTAAGELLLAHSHDILGELESARQRLITGAEPQQPGVRMCVASGLADRIIGPLLSMVLSKTFGLELACVSTREPERVVEALLTEDADVALTPLPFEHEGIATAEITRRELVLTVQADSPLARRRDAQALDDLIRLPLVVWREGADPSRIELELAERDLTANVIARADTPDTVAELVRTGLGAAILPRGAVDQDHGLAVLELDGGLPLRVTGLAWLRTHSGDPRLRRFVDLACRLREAF